MLRAHASQATSITYVHPPPPLSSREYCLWKTHPILQGESIYCMRTDMIKYPGKQDYFPHHGQSPKSEGPIRELPLMRLCNIYQAMQGTGRVSLPPYGPLGALMCYVLGRHHA